MSSGPDLHALLQSNLERVFSERDPEQRLAALEALYAPEPVMFEPDNVITGRPAISEVAGKLLESFGPDFTFTPVGRAVGHHGLAVLRWRAGPADGPVVVTGADAAEIVDGRIARLWVLLDPAPASAS